MQHAPQSTAVGEASLTNNSQTVVPENSSLVNAIGGPVGIDIHPPAMK
jgi:hypothetical protein